MAHELGHAFGLQHDFRDDVNIMSYGLERDRLSACHAKYLSVHPYFNPDTPIEEGPSPTIELISPRTYPAGSQSVPVRLKINDSEGLHQVLLSVNTIEPHAAAGFLEVKECRGLQGDRDTEVEFDYDGVVPSDSITSLSNPIVHPIYVEVADTSGNVKGERFVLFSEMLQPLLKISGDDQHGLPNTPLPIPFVIEVRDLTDGFVRGRVPVTFTVTAGSGTLSVTSTMTDENGRAESTLTLGPNPGTNAVEVSAAGITVTFNALAVAPVVIPDPKLQAAIGNALGKAEEEPIGPWEMATLFTLEAANANISDLTGLEDAINLTLLDLSDNSISDISAVSGLTNLISLDLSGNSISDMLAVADLTNLLSLYLQGNSISGISAVSGLTHLRHLDLSGNSISDISAVSGLTHLERLFLGQNTISNIPPVVGLTNLTQLDLQDNSISDISAVADLTNLLFLNLQGNSISDISPVSGLTTLVQLWLDGNRVSDITPLVGLTRLNFLMLENNSIYDLFPLIENTGLGAGDQINVSENPLNHASTHIYIRVLQIRGSTVKMDNLKPPTLEYSLSIPAGINLVHLPLKVTTADGVAKTIESIADLYNVLGGASKVNFLITYDSEAQEWRSYFGASDTGTLTDRTLADDVGIIAGMLAPASIRLTGSPLGTDGTSAITLNQGLNLVGLPLNDSRINRVSDLFALEGIGGNVPVIILTEGGGFKAVGRAGDPGDIPIVGGQSFIMTAQRETTVTLSGDGWHNTSGTVAAPPIALTGIEVGDTTPVLALKGSIVDEGTSVNQVGFRVTVKNLSTNREVAAVTGTDEAGYRLTVVDIETRRAAAVGDILEISARSRNPFIGVEPLRYTVAAEDVRRSLIQLPALVSYEIPAETELLANYPNPFNPETWIPYQLAADAFVTLTIYDGTGHVVRTLEVGHRIASAYENQSKAIYWDGRNDVGERVASGVYFYTLSAGDYSATQKMVVLK